MDESFDLLYYKSRVAERLNRPYDIIDFMDQLIIKKRVLNVNERNLLFTTYKKIIDSLRCIIQLLGNYLQDEINACKEDDNSSDNESFQDQLQIYIKKYIEELITTSEHVINTIDNILLKEANESESCIFYYKTRADYFRYIAEFTSNTEKEDAIKKSELSYQTALHLAQSNKHLKKSDPLYLGVALNFTVCEYEFMNKKTEMIDFSEKVFQEAVKTLDQLDENKYNESAKLMQLLRDNITQWTNEL